MNPADSQHSDAQHKPVHPRWFDRMLLALRLLWLGIPIATVVQLLNANALDTLSSVIVVMGGLIALLPLWERRSIEPLNLPPQIRRFFLLAGQIVLILIFIWMRSIIVNIEGQQKLNDAIETVTLVQAQTLLADATQLGIAVDQELQDLLLNALQGNSDNHTIRIAELLANSSSNIEPIQTTISSEIDMAISALDEMHLLKLVPIYVILDPATASKAAGEWNDMALQGFAQESPDIRTSRMLLNGVRVIDESESGSRTAEQKSVTLYNLALVSEKDDSLEEPYREALNLFREALELNPTSSEIRYALSSLMLSKFSSDTARLNEAVAVAENGRSYLPAGCELDENQLTTTNRDDAWSCFLLLSTEAGARFLREDIRRNIEPLLDRALLIAAANDHFPPLTGTQAEYYTAEAYYWYALLTEPDTDQEILCGIKLDYNRNNDRHRRWADYADDHLGNALCSPR